MLQWILVVIFAILSIILLTGKGGILIAGYNTSSKEEKARYDEKKLSRVTGIGFSFITVIMVLCAVYDFKLPAFLQWLVPWGIFLSIAFVVIATNVFCKKKPRTKAYRKAEDKWDRNVTIATLVFVFVICCFVSFMSSAGSVTVDMGGESMYIKAFIGNEKRLQYEDIKDVEYRVDLELGKRKNGIGSSKLQAGWFENDEFGDYYLYSYTKCNEYIVMKTSGQTVVVNGETKKETEKLYEEILLAIDEFME